MGDTKYITFLFLTSVFVCVLADYGYPYYPSYQSPCQSSCGNVRRTNYCQYLPCYSQNSYYSPYYSSYYRQYPYGYAYPSSRSVGYSGQYANGFLYPGQSSDPYANVPVEIIDDDDTTRQRPKAQKLVNRQDDYTNIPVEIIDVDDYSSFWRSVPRLPPKVTQSSQSTAGVSHGAITSESVSQTKPVRATITRTVQPLRKNPIISLDFVNGDSNKSENKAEITTQTPEGRTDPPTTAESEDVPEVKSWF